jgi:hypothetical protein
MKKYITIFMLENGYLAQEHTDTGGVFRSVYLKDISIDRLLLLTGDHGAVLKAIVMSAERKIPAIRAVREYIREQGLVDRSDGLKDVKDYVESIRSDWPNTGW